MTCELAGRINTPTLLPLSLQSLPDLQLNPTGSPRLSRLLVEWVDEVEGGPGGANVQRPLHHPAPGAGLDAAEKPDFGDYPQFVKGGSFLCGFVCRNTSHTFVSEP